MADMRFPPCPQGTVPLDEATFSASIAALSGIETVDPGTYALLGFRDADASMARGALVKALQDLVAANPAKQLLWRWPPSVGPRRGERGIDQVASCRIGWMDRP